ncbi:hypothetical protein [Pseudomonas vanderleydeniana]|uniref:hypothetical protein n=1 Tax=Pseudomonas vanderleydeniana TaxID=2745495 RepID=UPI001CED46BC|nr:hypothetical protein [Pseudomonas vanderleydeniana]
MSAKTPGKAKTLELSAPQRLDEQHDLSNFDCAENSINEYLFNKAHKAQAAKHAVVHVVCLKDTQKVMGYCTVSILAKQWDPPPCQSIHSMKDSPIFTRDMPASFPAPACRSSP